MASRNLKNIFKESFWMAIDAIRKNKLRSSLTLLGISIGVFSVIGVMTAIRTLESSIASGLNVFAANTFVIQKYPEWDFGRPDRKYRNRKNITIDQYKILKENQIFWVCPLIEESESIQVRAATEEHDRLTRNVFPDLKLGLLHGRLSSKEKNDEMERFRNGETNILIATPVVEVGVDIPNASVMLVEGANRFGLSQLHQLRGRVGRGKEPGYCLLLADNAGEEAERRLSAMERLGDGFAVAEEDLRLRGPGDFLGTRQSGLPELKIASLEDHQLLTLARREAAELLSKDPTLKKHPQLFQIIAAYQTRLVTDIS